MVPVVPVPVAGAKEVVAQVEASAADVAGKDTDTLKIHIKNRDGEFPPSLFSLLSEPLKPLSAIRGANPPFTFSYSSIDRLEVRMGEETVW